METSTKDLIRKTQAIIFDCDGTLVNSAPIYSTAWANGFRLSGNEMTAHWYSERKGLSEQLLINAFENEYKVRLERDEVVTVMRKTYLKNIVKLSEISSICRIAREHYGRIPLAVASSGPAELVESSLRALKLDELFTEIITQDQVTTAKPSPEIFLKAADRLGVQPEHCLVFEDSEQGFEAAKAAHMPFVDVTNIISGQ